MVSTRQAYTKVLSAFTSEEEHSEARWWWVRLAQIRKRQRTYFLQIYFHALHPSPVCFILKFTFRNL
ncbi:MAG: hypothetical protein ACI9O6_002178 [Glaciecola sp.]|jgi:hypothetical protein